jgi:hypothetical protein
MSREEIWYQVLLNQIQKNLTAAVEDTDCDISKRLELAVAADAIADLADDLAVAAAVAADVTAVAAAALKDYDNRLKERFKDA